MKALRLYHPQRLCFLGVIIIWAVLNVKFFLIMQIFSGDCSLDHACRRKRFYNLPERTCTLSVLQKQTGNRKSKAEKLSLPVSVFYIFLLHRTLNCCFTVQKMPAALSWMLRIIPGFCSQTLLKNCILLKISQEYYIICTEVNMLDKLNGIKEKYEIGRAHV